MIYTQLICSLSASYKVGWGEICNTFTFTTSVKLGYQINLKTYVKFYVKCQNKSNSLLPYQRQA